MTLPEELDVIHLPLDAGQKTPRHVLRLGVTAATCRWCNRFVLRWSLMGKRDRALYAAGIRAQMKLRIWY